MIERERRRAIAGTAPWAVLLVILVITAFATRYVYDTSYIADRARFASSVQTTRDAIQFRLETYVNVLRAAGGLFAADPDPTRDEFRAYVQQLQVQQRYPGIQGIGLTIRIRPQHVDDVTGDLRANEFPDFHIWPWSKRDDYQAIVMIEPLDRRNRAAIGYDMTTEPVRRVAMNMACDSGRAAATGRVTLVQEIEPGKQPGFLIYVPIYTTKLPPPTVAERREALFGYVYAPFRVYDLFSGILGSVRPDVRFSVYDGADLLYASEPRHDKSEEPRFRSRAHFTVADRDWTIVFEAENVGAGPRLTAAAGTALGGLIIALLLFFLMRVELHARAAAELTAERLRRSEAELQRASTAKDEFLATLSHELRTPMTAIMGWSKLLAEPLDHETYNTAVDSIQKSSKAQAQLIDDLLDISRITAGKMRIDPRPMELAPIVTTAIGAVAPMADGKGVGVSVTAPAAPLLVNGDTSRLQQVVWNLLTNAVKFTPPGGRVDVSLQHEDGQAVLSVSDTGRGIEPEFLPHVFERFRQADSSTTRSYTGLGLGLAIVHHLVALHGGSVEAASDGVGKGARFIVRLPVLPVTETVDDGKVAERAVMNTLSGAHILLVDDEEAVRNYGGAVFRMSGAHVRCVRSAVDALEALHQSPADIVVTDIGMPGVDGYELLRRIRDSSDPRVATAPVVALTAYARPEDRERAEQAGFEAFVPKPVDPGRLRAAVADVLSAVRHG